VGKKGVAIRIKPKGGQPSPDDCRLSRAVTVAPPNKQTNLNLNTNVCRSCPWGDDPTLDDLGSLTHWSHDRSLRSQILGRPARFRKKKQGPPIRIPTRHGATKEQVDWCIPDTPHATNAKKAQCAVISTSHLSGSRQCDLLAPNLWVRPHTATRCTGSSKTCLSVAWVGAMRRQLQDVP
jgi:hypothetical protein